MIYGAIEMEHYLIIDNDVWKKFKLLRKKGKAKNILLMAIPKEHMRRFHEIDDAKEIWKPSELVLALLSTSSTNILEKEAPAGFAVKIYWNFLKISVDLESEFQEYLRKCMCLHLNNKQMNKVVLLHNPKEDHPLKKHGDGSIFVSGCSRPHDRRLGHINFKNLNKLVKGNLVRGLPSKVTSQTPNAIASEEKDEDAELIVVPSVLRNIERKELNQGCSYEIQRKKDGDRQNLNSRSEILKKFDLVSVKTAITPMETKVALTKDEKVVDVDVQLYRSMIGSLMYLTASSPDIMYHLFDLGLLSMIADYGGVKSRQGSSSSICHLPQPSSSVGFLQPPLSILNISHLKLQIFHSISTLHHLTPFTLHMETNGKQYSFEQPSYPDQQLLHLAKSYYFPTLEVALKRKTKRVLLSDSEEEETEARGRKFNDLDPLVSLLQELITPSKTPSKTVNASGEEQSVDKGKRYKRRKVSKESVGTGLDFEEVNDPVTTDSIRVLYSKYLLRLELEEKERLLMREKKRTQAYKKSKRTNSFKKKQRTAGIAIRLDAYRKSLEKGRKEQKKRETGSVSCVEDLRVLILKKILLDIELEHSA
ncbi:hypothetical protein Tco_1302875 [Tanacetum coccineum]